MSYDPHADGMAGLAIEEVEEAIDFAFAPMPNWRPLPFYENEIYAVIGAEDNEGYAIINKVTDIVEARTGKLPSAIDTADVTRNVLKRILDEKDANEASQ